jgi:hypothetical protein
LIDYGSIPVIPVAKYLKYLDNTAKSSNTLKTYYYSLMLKIGLDIHLLPGGPETVSREC